MITDYAVMACIFTANVVLAFVFLCLCGSGVIGHDPHIDGLCSSFFPFIGIAIQLLPM